MNHYQATFDAWNSVAERYQAGFMDLTLYNDSYDAFCRRIEAPDARIFEIGCGPGNITRYLLAQRPDFRIDATDVAPRMIELAARNCPAARCTVMDCRALDTLHPEQPYHGIMCGFTLPYLSQTDTEKLLLDCAALLLPGGIVYISAIEGDYEQSGLEADSSGKIRMYVHYHSEAFLQKALRDAGFGNIDTLRVPYTKSDGSSSIHLILIGQKNEAGSDPATQEQTPPL